ncbi:MAG: Hsp20/alpha crystallin family protein [Burkholderiales bacterium]|nr:Hsp20/alpha crystallin family protein [Burkholderiales bacterium]
MNLNTYDPWNIVNDFFGFPLHRLDGSASANRLWIPAVDLRDEKDNYIIEADLPGVDQDDISVFIEDGRLIVEGKRDQQTKEETDSYSCMERSCGTFRRQFTLPDIADSDNINANYYNGVLKLRIPKKEASKPKRISIMGKNEHSHNNNNVDSKK